MITINADSLRSSIEEVRKRGLEAKIEARDKYRSEILHLFGALLNITPQFSGEMVFNWDIQVGDEPSGGFQHLPSKFDPKPGSERWREKRAPEHEAGDLNGPANSAYMRGVRRIADIAYFGQPVTFINHSPLEIDTPMIINVDDHSVQELRSSEVIFAWTSITSFLQAYTGIRT